jgi:pyruvate-ferredoxin/flavodoxin oxidoreductase
LPKTIAYAKAFCAETILSLNQSGIRRHGWLTISATAGHDLYWLRAGYKRIGDDTEVYSNTEDRLPTQLLYVLWLNLLHLETSPQKKNLGSMAMSYGYVYVAHVAWCQSGSELKAIRELKAYPGVADHLLCSLS